MSETETCPSCGGEYKRLGQHWNMNPNCDYPPLNETQKGVIRYFHEKHGFGTVDFRDRASHPYLTFRSMSGEVIEEIATHLTWMAGSVGKHGVGGLQRTEGPGWRVRTRSHPWLMRYVDESPTVGDPVVVESTFDMGVSRWQDHGYDRLYLNAFDGDPYIDLDRVELVAPDHLGMQMGVEGDTVHIRGKNVFGEYEAEIDLRGNEDDVRE